MDCFGRNCLPDSAKTTPSFTENCEIPFSKILFQRNSKFPVSLIVLTGRSGSVVCVSVCVCVQCLIINKAAMINNRILISKKEFLAPNISIALP